MTQLLTLICANYINDDCVKKLSLLTDLNLNGLISDKGIKDLTNLTCLYLDHNENISNFGIKKLTNLQTLDIHDSSKITRFGITHLTKLSSIFPNRYLWVDTIFS